MSTVRVRVGPPESGGSAPTGAAGRVCPPERPGTPPGVHEPERDALQAVAPRGPRLLLYAERPRRRTRQMLADLLVVTWVVVVVLAATAAHEAVLALQAPGRNLADAGGRVSGAFTDAAGAADNVPLVGARLAGALGGGTRAGQSLVDAGNTQVETAAAAATGLAWLVVVIAAVPVAAVWVVLRARWVIAARAVPGAAAGWRRGDPRVVAELADVALTRHGLRGPTLVQRAS